jgi:hypothetical protein
MKKRRLLPRAVLAAVLLAIPAAADAPRDQYEPFDGDTPTIKDNFTKLEWDRRGVVANVTFGPAGAGCSFIASLEGVGRLPTIKELLTILDEEPHEEYEFSKLVTKHIDAVAFPSTAVDLPYWSSTPGAAGKVWVLSFATGRMDQLSTTDPVAKANARCVR